MPTPQKYLDFDLEILPQGAQYRAHVLASPGGQGMTEFALPFDDLTIENLLLKMGYVRRLTRGPDAKKIDAAKKFGGALYSAVFAGDVGRCWHTSLLDAEQQSIGLRLRLRLNQSPELADLPWEFLYDASLNQFLNHSIETPLVRFLDLPSPPRPLALEPPLNILVMVSLPKDAEELDADQEWKNLNSALEPLMLRGLVTLERSDDATMLALQRKLRQGEYHVLHFIGHGAYDSGLNASVLYMEDATGRARLVSGDHIGTLLHDHRSLRLVMLNACEGARNGRTDPFSGVAQSLIRQGIPAAVAMQFPITDGAALLLSREFYSALADSYPIDAALSEARKALYLDGNETEWATPVLYLRAPDGIIFDIRGSPIPSAPETKPQPAAKTQPPAPTESLTYDELMRRATTAQNRAEQIWSDTPTDEEAWREKFQEAYTLLQSAENLRHDDISALLQMAQVQARVENNNEARRLVRRVEDLIGEPMNDDHVRKLGEAFFLHATLSDPPNENLLKRARPHFERLNDSRMLDKIESLLHRAAHPNASSLKDFYDETDSHASLEFNPIGKWNIQVHDMVGSRMLIEFSSNGTFQMLQQVGTYQVPVNGSWTFNPLTKQLALNGVVNTFQPFILAITISGKLPNGFAAVGNDGIGYVLTRG